MSRWTENFLRIALVLALLLLASCVAAPPRSTPEQALSLAYLPEDDTSLAARYAPLVVPANSRAYNRLGTPMASLTPRGKEQIRVDPARPAMYVRQRSFQIGEHRYTNLIYRLHFREVPYVHLTSGKNVGLLVVITLDEAGHPLLITTVHTCGCYLAFIPTSYLPASAYPAEWNRQRQKVFGIQLPGMLQYPAVFTPALRPLIFLRDATHRVQDVKLANLQNLPAYRWHRTPLRPVTELEHLPLPGGGETSFFHKRGFSRGYVKNTFKPFELLLMSWWALDLHVGVDKRYGERHASGSVFYTSLRPWYRSASDMWNFPAFLRFWGWRLGNEA